MRAMRKARAGFTLVEMLVTVALMMFIMILLAGAFQQGIDMFRTLRAQALNADKLRMAMDVLRQDLASPHFESLSRNGLGGPFLSDQRLDRDGWKPPSGGFFRIWQWFNVSDPFAPAAYTVPEGQDGDRILSMRSAGNVLHFTMRWGGDRPGDYFRTVAPDSFFVPDNPPNPLAGVDELAAFSDQPSPIGTRPSGLGIYAGRWAEVAYFLVPTPNRQTAAGGPDGLPVYSLRRRIRVIPHATNNNGAPPSYDPSPLYRQLSQNNELGSATAFNLLSDLTVPRVRMGAENGVPDGRYAFYGAVGTTRRPPTWDELGLPNNLFAGEDILLTDVISFDVKVYGAMNVNLPAAGWPRMPPANPDYPFDDLPPPASGLNTGLSNIGAQVFDTWGSNASPPAQDWTNPASYLSPGQQQVPLRMRIKALQIRLRVWDIKTQQVRQVTFIQEV
jgi:type II secretory pathway pseudopilin PulG